MKVELKQEACIITKEEGDKPIKTSRGGWGSPESGFLYLIKKELIKQGYDVIKKLMWKDGHLVSDYDHYIRTRKVKGPNSFAIWDGNHAIRSCAEDYKRDGMVILNLIRDLDQP